MIRLVRWLLVCGILGLLMSLLAGTWRDPWLWAYVSMVTVIGAVAMLSIDNDLARERFRPPSRGADGPSLRAIRLLALIHLAVGVLDGARLHWSSVPPVWRLAGLIGFGASFLLVVRAMTVNRFFSAVVRVQDDRGHHVIDAGPYAVVRHPGYAGMVPAVPCSALALGSWPSLAIALLYSLLILRRVQVEDRFLHEHLDGYGAYARRVRYRLVPAVW